MGTHLLIKNNKLYLFSKEYSSVGDISIYSKKYKEIGPISTTLNIHFDIDNVLIFYNRRFYFYTITKEKSNLLKNKTYTPIEKSFFKDPNIKNRLKKYIYTDNVGFGPSTGGLSNDSSLSSTLGHNLSNESIHTGSLHNEHNNRHDYYNSFIDVKTFKASQQNEYTYIMDYLYHDLSKSTE